MGHFYDFPLARTLTMTRLVRPLAVLFSLLGLTAAGWASAPQARAQASMFSTQEVDQARFIIVAAPIGDGSRAQLNIYEQRSAQRPCYAVSGSRPAVVDPLLATFDFTGICNRFIDGNGYSLRIGTADLGTVYRLSVVKDSAETLLMAQPTRPDAGPEMVVARTGGQGNGFLLLVAEPGWRVMRRSFGSRALGHVYVYRDSWPEGATATSSAPQPQTAAPAAKAPVDPKAPVEQKGASKPQALPDEKPALSGPKSAPGAAAVPSPGSGPSPGPGPSQEAAPAPGTRPSQSLAPRQGATPKPGLGAPAVVPVSGTSKPVAVAQPNGPIPPVQTTKSATATKALAATKAFEIVKPPKPVAAASKPTAAVPNAKAAAPLAAAPNLPALPAAAPLPVKALP